VLSNGSCFSSSVFLVLLNLDSLTTNTWRLTFGSNVCIKLNEV